MDNNKIIIEPMKLVPSSQAYFWSDTAQNDMLEAKKDVNSGDVREFKTISEFLNGIKQWRADLNLLENSISSLNS